MHDAQGSKALFSHPCFAEAVVALKCRILKSPRGSIFRLCAPTGAGKSEIAFAIARALAGPPSTWRPGELPVAIVRARKEDRGSFSPKHFASRMHAAVNQPDIRWALAENQSGLEPSMEATARLTQRSEFWTSLRQNSNEILIRDACEDSWIARGVRYVIVDDANAMAAIRGGAKPSDMIQPWVAGVERTGVSMLFVGTSAMYSLWDGEGEIQRRAGTNYVRRYRIEIQADRKAFISLLVSMTKGSEWEKVDIRRHAEEIYFVTFGIFGQVKKLLFDASNNAAAAERKHVTTDDLYAARPNKHELQRIAARIAEYDLLSAPATHDFAKEIYATIVQGKSPAGTP